MSWIEILNTAQQTLLKCFVSNTKYLLKEVSRYLVDLVEFRDSQLRSIEALLVTPIGSALYRDTCTVNFCLPLSESRKLKLL